MERYERKSPPWYHATIGCHGESALFESGRFYEKLDNGTPVPRTYEGEVIGFEKSGVPELAASKTPEGAVFAVLKNYINDTGDCGGTGRTLTVSVYAINRDPDVDVSDSDIADFSTVKEVRYRNLDDDPIRAGLARKVEIPDTVLGDVEVAYTSAPGPNNVDETWAVSVLEAIKATLSGRQYPESLSPRVAKRREQSA